MERGRRRVYLRSHLDTQNTFCMYVPGMDGGCWARLGRAYDPKNGGVYCAKIDTAVDLERISSSKAL